MIYCIGDDPVGSWMNNDGTLINYYYDKESTKTNGLINQLTYDSSQLISSYDDGTLIVWDMDISKEKMHLKYKNNKYKSTVTAMHVPERSGGYNYMLIANGLDKVNL